MVSSAEGSGIKDTPDKELGLWEALYKARGVTEKHCALGRKRYCIGKPKNDGTREWHISDYQRWQWHMDYFVAKLATDRDQRMESMAKDMRCTGRTAIIVAGAAVVVAALQIVVILVLR